MSDLINMKLRKINNSNSKDGSVIVFSLFIMIMIFTIFALLISFVNMFGIGENAHRAVDTVAKTRAQAIDVPLKEEYGFIEVINTGYDENKYKFLNNDNFFKEMDSKRSDKPTPGYDFAISPKTDQKYISAVNNANSTAKNAGLNQLLDQYPFTEGSTSNLPFSKPNKKNFCIEVFPLPKEDTNKVNTGGSIELGCQVEVKGEKIDIFPKNIEIKGRNNALNNPYEKDNAKVPEIENKKLNVTNGVFVGFAYEDTENNFYKFLKNMTKNTGLEMDPPVRVIHKIAYPQIDAHSFGDVENWGPQGW